jgi:type IV secretory pathway TrbF-like protein
MSGRKILNQWWQELIGTERFNSAEWLMLGVSALALAGAAVALARVLQ